MLHTDVTANPRDILDQLLPLLISPEVIYFPIRHHSPACALHLRRLILEIRPSAVLVEGPDSFDPLIPLILHEQTRAPIAIYTSYIDKQGRLVPPDVAAALAAATGRKPDPARFAGYYPFCDYSPELVALRAGREVGATLRFIDLTYPEQLLAEREELASDPNPRARSLLEESHLRRSQYLLALAKRAGCRDPNDLWDHLFESDNGQTDPREFLRRVAAYCAVARIEYTPEALASDGTIAREQTMAAHIADQLATNRAASTTAPIIVVTGGFHTAALPMLVGTAPKRPKPLKLADDETQTAIMRYSFERLDAHNGYSAGMPSPHYYNRLWQRMTGAPETAPAKKDKKRAAQDSALGTQHSSPAATQIAAELLVHIGRLSREKNLAFALSTADEIAALEHCRRVADLRGHVGPTREDLLDAVRSCFVKGDMAVEGAAVMAVVGAILSGTDIGDIPPDAGVPPIVEDFRRIAQRLNINITDSVRKRVSLDIYRKAAHRQVSRFLHTLTFLNAPFAMLAGGPDFVTGRGLELLHEHWEYGWTPMTESALIEASVFGSTLEEAATNRLRQTIAELESAGQARSTVAAVRTLISACRMGLHRHVDDLLDLIDDNVNNDPSFPSLVSGLNELALLWQSREPLEAHKLPQVPVLAQTAYRKACFLAANLGGCPEQETEQALTALATLREAIHLEDAPPVEDDDETTAAPLNLFDPPLLFDPLRALLAATTGNPTLVGGAAGILFTEAQITEDQLLSLAVGQLNSTTLNFAAKTAFLRGLLHTARESAWRLPGLLQALDRLFGDWSDDAFTRSLPDLRLAFSSLTPRETDRVADLIAKLHGRKTLGPLHHRDVTEAEVAFNVRLNAGVAEALAADHLADWKK
jgi:hypothetical protein